MNYELHELRELFRLGLAAVLTPHNTSGGTRRLNVIGCEKKSLINVGSIYFSLLIYNIYSCFSPISPPPLFSRKPAVALRAMAGQEIRKKRKNSTYLSPIKNFQPVRRSLGEGGWPTPNFLHHRHCSWRLVIGRWILDIPLPPGLVPFRSMLDVWCPPKANNFRHFSAL